MTNEKISKYFLKFHIKYPLIFHKVSQFILSPVQNHKLTLIYSEIGNYLSVKKYCNNK